MKTNIVDMLDRFERLISDAIADYRDDMPESYEIVETDEGWTVHDRDGGGCIDINITEVDFWR